MDQLTYNHVDVSFEKNIFSEYVDILTTIVTILNNEGCIAGSNCSSNQTLLNGEKVLV